MSFIVQISPFVHLFMFKIVFRYPPPGLCPGPAGGLKWPPEPSPQVVPTFHFISSYSPEGVPVKKAIFWSVTVYNKNVSIQCHLSALIKQGQDKQFYM